MPCGMKVRTRARLTFAERALFLGERERRLVMRFLHVIVQLRETNVKRCVFLELPAMAVITAGTLHAEASGPGGAKIIFGKKFR